MAWYIAALPATEPTSDRRSRRLGFVSLSFGMTGLVPRACASTDKDWFSRAPAASPARMRDQYHSSEVMRLHLLVKAVPGDATRYPVKYAAK
jgi:hypothetical protein